MTIDSFDTVFLTLAFIVPGFVIQSMIGISVPRREEAAHLSFLRFLTMSCGHYALWSWLVYLLHNTLFFAESPALSAVAWFWIVLFAPALEGLVFGRFHSHDRVFKFLVRLGFLPIHVIPTGWDFKFSRIRSERYLIVTLKDGSQVHGLFAGQSFASDVPTERDLFLERTYRYADNTWEQVPGQDGILIAGDQVKYIEFIKSLEPEDVQR